MMQTGLIAFEIICRINNIGIDIRSIVRENGISDGEISKEELLLIAKNAEFKAKIKPLEFEKFSKYPFPAIFILNDKTFGVILKPDCGNQKALVFLPEDQKAKELSFEDISKISNGEIIFLSHKLMNEQIKFGFKWFFVEILKYKRIIAEVMLGSFVVQLFGLVTPLFTQVILDKVIVHRSMSTLDVLGIAFVAVSIFAVAMPTTTIPARQIKIIPPRILFAIDFFFTGFSSDWSEK